MLSTSHSLAPMILGEANLIPAASIVPETGTAILP